MGTETKKHKSREVYDRERERSRSTERRRSRSRSRENRRKRSRSRDRGARDKPRKDQRQQQKSQRDQQQQQQQEKDEQKIKEEHKERAEALKPEPGEEEEGPPKEGVNLGLSGALAADTNTFNGIVIKYSEPPEARKPKRRWRFYVFKGEEVMPTLHLHRQSAFLMGRDRKVCDLPIDHPSCSKQHAVYQYRMISKKRADGTDGNRVVPYIIDLGSANGTFLNNNKIEAQRYYELQEKDVLKFGFSTREYVLLHAESDD